MSGPLFGFLVGAVVGRQRTTLQMSPIFLPLFVGFMVAGLGLGAMLLGVRRLLTAATRPRAEAKPATVTVHHYALRVKPSNSAMRLRSSDS